MGPVQDRSPRKARWSKACEKAFQQLKKHPCKQSDLASPDFSKELVLQTGVGAGLSQEAERSTQGPGERRNP